MSQLPSSPVSTNTRRRFVWAGVASFLAWVALRLVAPGVEIPWTTEMRTASHAMASAVESLAGQCEGMGIPIDPLLDPNGTCLVGPEISELFTSLGQLQAKRSTTNPDMAGLVAHLLAEAGVVEGDRVAVGASGSFPALMVATLAAVQALGGQAVTILSLGASSYGATRTDLHLLDIYRVMEREGMVGAPPVALSLGGGGDEGREFDPAFKENLLQELRASGLPLLLFPDLEANVTERMARYGVVPESGQESGSAPGGEEEGRVAAFVNIGGAEANIGTSPVILDMPPGLWKRKSSLPLPPQEQRGVLFRMAAAGVPVIHLLHIRGLALRYGLSWDPIPLPEPGSTLLMDGQKGKGTGFWVLTVLYFTSLALLGVALRHGSRPS